MKSHEDLDVWNKGVDFAVQIYAVTKGYPAEERFGLVSQMRRAAVSISSNIAEGAARKGQKEFSQFLCIAAGSASELDTQLLISQRLGLTSVETLMALRADLRVISKMLQGLRKAIKC